MVLNSVPKFLTLIKFSHTIFALPFAMVSVILAMRNLPPEGLPMPVWEMVVWVILAMVGARSGAMGFNRFIDRKWDAANPRTASRPSVTGEISPNQMAVMIVISFLLLIFAAWKLNPMAFYLSPVAIFLVCFYSYCKRFTSFAHLFLGLAIGAAPVAAWIAVTGEITMTALLIGGSVLTWIAGFDVLYALQDYEFDKSAGLNSIPVRFGVRGSLLIARILHLLTVLFWFLLGGAASLNVSYYAGVIVCGGLLLWEHSLVKENDLSKINIAFMNMNSVISIAFFSAVSFDVLIF